MGEKVSVIVPSLNERNNIKNCIESLINNNYPHDSLEILVVDGYSEDGTIEIIEKLCNENSFVHLIWNKERITPVALNLGVLMAKGDYIMIAGAHSWFPPDYISKLVNYLKKDDVSVVGAVLETRVKKTNTKALAITKVLSNKFGVGNSYFRVGIRAPLKVDTVPFGLYKRSVFQEVGNYNEKLVRNHDIEFSKRILKKGLNIYLLPDPVCYYYARDNYSDLAKNNFQNGLWNILTIYITKNKGSLSIRHFVPLSFILSLIIPVLISLFVFPSLIFVTIVLFSLYILSISLISLRITQKPLLYLNVILSFIIIHFSYGFGSLLGCTKFRYLLTKR
jgi:glycosyltransferase involved in cell wall biosynthesis